MRLKLYQLFGKRTLDLILTVPFLLVLLRCGLLVGACVWIFLGVPVFFIQRRPGLHEKPFGLIKFRTMKNGRKDRAEIQSDLERLTCFGRFLRSTSLDEIPELINVLRGEMSLVGPRPLLIRYLDRYTPRQRRRHEVLPGITGWAQVNGRNSLPWEERFELDVWYVDHCSFSMDVKILLTTLWKTLRREGITELGHPTMPEFLGSAGRSAGKGQADEKGV